MTEHPATEHPVTEHPVTEHPVTEHHVTDAATITAILTSDAVAPPSRPGGGAALQLRAAMARFAAGDDHGSRRRAVEEVAATLDADDLARLARRVSRPRLLVGGDDAMVVARTVPVHALLAALGSVSADDASTADRVVGDVDAVASVIGRGATPTDEADDAASRLLALATTTAHDPIAVVSLLHQCLDATAALIATELHARARTRASGRHVGAVAAVPRTVRVATATGEVGAHRLECGDVVHLAIGPAGLQFGAGPHGCPGRRVAEAITAAVVDAIEVDHELELDGVSVDADGRPLVLPLRRRPLPAGGTG